MSVGLTHITSPYKPHSEGNGATHNMPPFCFLYKLNSLKLNSLNIEENRSTEPVPKIISCSHRRGTVHNGFAFSQSFSLTPLLWAAGKAWGERARSNAMSHIMPGLPPKTRAMQHHSWCLVLWQAQLSRSLWNTINSFSSSALHSPQFFLLPTPSGPGLNMDRLGSKHIPLNANLLWATQLWHHF